MTFACFESLYVEGPEDTLERVLLRQDNDMPDAFEVRRVVPFVRELCDFELSHPIAVHHFAGPKTARQAAAPEAMPGYGLVIRLTEGRSPTAAESQRNSPLVRVVEMGPKDENGERLVLHQQCVRRVRVPLDARSIGTTRAAAAIAPR